MNAYVHNKIVASVVVAVVAFFSIAAIFVCAGMNTTATTMAGHHMAAAPSECLGDSTTAACPMSLDQHLTTWHVLAQTIVTINALFAVLVFVVLVARYAGRESICSGLGARMQYYLRHHQHFRLHDYLQELFSRGILQAKLFA